MSRFYVSIHVQTKRDIASAMAGGERGQKVDLGTWMPQELERGGSHRKLEVKVKYSRSENDVLRADSDIVWLKKVLGIVKTK